MSISTGSRSASSLVGRPLPPEVVRIFGDLHFKLDGTLLAIAYSDSNCAWTIEESGVLRQWEVAAARQLSQAQLSDVEMVWAFSPRAELLASGSNDLALWETPTGKLRARLDQPAWVNTLTFNPDGTALAIGRDTGDVCLFNPRTLKVITEWEAHEDPLATLAFSPDGRTLATAAEDQIIRLWDLGSGRLKGELTGHTGRIQALAWHPSGKLLASAGWDTTARVWDCATCEPLILLNAHSEIVTALAFSPDGRTLATADSSNAIWLWDPLIGKPIILLRGHAGSVNSLTFSPSGKHLLSGGEDRRLLLWDVATGQNLSGMADPHSEIARIALSGDGKFLAYVNGSPMLRVWDTETAAETIHLNMPSNVCAVTVAARSPALAIGCENGAIHLWPDGPSRLARKLEAHRTSITSLALTADGKRLASSGATDGYVYIWNSTAEEPVLLIPEATDNGTVEVVAWHPTEPVVVAGGIDWLATGDTDGAVCLWDVEDKAKLVTFPCGTTRLTVRPDGKQMAVATLTNSVCLWDLERETLVHELLGDDGMITCVAYRWDGELLATGSDNGSLCLWSPGTGELLGIIDLGTPIKDVLFSPGGELVYTANANITCYAVAVGKH